MESSMLIQSVSLKSPLVVRQKVGFRHNEDIISSLPDELLSRILSSLPIKDAIRSSILSPRWKYLWTCVPNLEFEFDKHYYSGYEKFTNIVDNLCHHHDGRLCIEKFRISANFKTLPYPNINKLISFLTSRNIKEFNLRLLNIVLCPLPSSLLTCKTLVVLILRGQFQLNPPTTLSLPCLKSLHLESIEYSSGVSVERLLSGCPVLEVLVITTYKLDDTCILNISVPSLKRLSLQYEPPNDFNVHNSEFITLINAPNLEYLMLYDYGSKYFSLNSMPSLVEAHVDVMSLATSPMDFGRIDIISAISDVKILSLFGYTVDSLRHSYGHQHLPIFRNVVNLQLDSDKSNRWDFVLNLLQSLPKLQVLVFKEGIFDLYYSKEDLKEPEDVPVCLSLCLKTIEIYEYQGGEVDEFMLLAYLLEKAKVLENLILHCNSYNKHLPGCSIKHDRVQQLPCSSSSYKLRYIH